MPSKRSGQWVIRPKQWRMAVHFSDGRAPECHWFPTEETARASATAFIDGKGTGDYAGACSVEIVYANSCGQLVR